MKLKCLIVDDEPLAQRVVEKYIADIPNLEVAGKCNNAMEAMNALYKSNIDLMFLDVNMPKISGLDFLKTLKKPPHVIITTAYRDYAVEGFELDVVDYLKKPFSFGRFMAAVSKVQSKIQNEQAVSLQGFVLENNVRQQIEESFIFVKVEKISYKVNIKEILYVESIGDYLKIFTVKKVYLTYQTLKKLETILPSRHFPRVHKSYIVAVSKINNIEGNRISINDIFVPIGRIYKKDFMELIQSFSE